MAALQNIRNHGKLIGIIIGGALLAFILSDLDFRTLVGENRQIVGEVDGTQIKIQDYQALMAEATVFYQVQSGTQTLNEQQAQQVQKNVFEAWQREQILGEQCADLGLVVTDAELASYMTGKKPHPMLSQLRMFYNPDKGGFDEVYLQQFLNTMDQDETGNSQLYWNFLKRTIHQQVLEAKYMVLVGASFNYNNIDAKFDYDAQQPSNIQFALKSFYAVPDSMFSASETEIADRYEGMKSSFVQAEESRDISFIVYKVRPSVKDYETIKVLFNDLQREFSTADDFIALSNQNSDVPYKGIAYSIADTDKDLKEFAFSAKKDEVYGPKLFGDTYKMARIVETGISAPDSVRARHILVQEATAAATQSLTDSLMGLINNGADFAVLATEYSRAGTAQQAGDLGWFKEDGLDKVFAAACFSAKIGKVFAIPMGMGIQIIEVTDKTKNVDKVRMCVLESKVTPSTITYNRIYSEASQYVAKNNTLATFKDSAKIENGQYLRHYKAGKNDPSVAELKSSRSVIQWAYKNDQGDVAETVFECGDAFVVAALNEVVEKGIKPLRVVKEQVKALVINDKKAAKIKADLNKQISDGKGVASLGLPVQSVEAVSFSSSSINGLGKDLKVIGSVSSLSEGEAPLLVQSNRGVCALSLQAARISQAPYNQEQQLVKLSSARQPYAYLMFNALKEDMELTDKRYNFY